MRDVIDVLVLVALTLQMLTNTLILLGVFALLISVYRKPIRANVAPIMERSVPPAPKNPCDHCQAELGDPVSSRISEDVTTLVYQCQKCGLPSERQV